MTRRDFLVRGGVCAAALGMRKEAPPVPPAGIRSRASDAPLITRALGRTGLTLPVVSMGLLATVMREQGSDPCDYTYVLKMSRLPYRPSARPGCPLTSPPVK